MAPNGWTLSSSANTNWQLLFLITFLRWKRTLKKCLILFSQNCQKTYCLLIEGHQLVIAIIYRYAMIMYVSLCQTQVKIRNTTSGTAILKA